MPLTTLNHKPTQAATSAGTPTTSVTQPTRTDGGNPDGGITFERGNECEIPVRHCSQTLLLCPRHMIHILLQGQQLKTKQRQLERKDEIERQASEATQAKEKAETGMAEGAEGGKTAEEATSLVNGVAGGEIGNGDGGGERGRHTDKRCAGDRGGSGWYQQEAVEESKTSATRKGPEGKETCRVLETA